MSRLNPRFPRAWLRVITLGVLIALTVVGVSTTQAQDDPPSNMLEKIILTDPNGDKIELNESVETDVFEYTATVTNRVKSVTLTVETEQFAADVVITDDDSPVSSPLSAYRRLLSDTTLTTDFIITVTESPDSDSTADGVYTVAVTRHPELERLEDCPTYDIWCSSMQVGHTSTSTDDPPVRRDEYGYLEDDLSFGELSHPYFYSSPDNRYNIAKLLFVRTEEGNPDELVISYSLLLRTDRELNPEWTFFVGEETYAIEPTTLTGVYWEYTIDLEGSATAPVLMEGGLVLVGLVVPSPKLSLSQSNEAIEGSPITFTVTSDREATLPIATTLLFSIEDGDTATFDSSAVGGADFDHSRVTIFINVGDTTTTAPVMVETYQDDVAERDETFTATLAPPQHAVLAEGFESAQGLILNDDDG